MAPACSFPRQKHVTYYEPDEPNPQLPSYSLNSNFNIIFSYILMFALSKLIIQGISFLQISPPTQGI